MSALRELIAKGGPVMIAILALSVVLYSWCFSLLLSLRHARRSLRAEPAVTPEEIRALRRRQAALQENFRHQRLALGAMIAAAPLMGLLGTVTGMEATFAHLASQGQKSMEGLAGGISEVLVATESGLLVAIPALLLVYVAHRQTHKLVEQLNRLAGRSKEARP
ncbi:MAG TPA: MotA/TolQ/ExbB proton channel family protein [Lacunisphaera sp.]|nr:MotA/TolQ/ExbB proton channel family protein [Lacunisphaera sp.]